jgi:hypothetical protein
MADTITAVRLSKKIISAAREAGQLQTRSIAAQVEHWARLGRAIENAPRVEKALIDRLLHNVSTD